jgi:hypothetical protein
MRWVAIQNDALFIRPEIGQIHIGTWKDDDREFHTRLSIPSKLPRSGQPGHDYTLPAQSLQEVSRTDVLTYDSQSVVLRNKPAGNQGLV